MPRLLVYISLGLLTITLSGAIYLAFTMEPVPNAGHFGRSYRGLANFVDLTGSHIFRVSLRNTLYLWIRLSLLLALLAYPLSLLLARKGPQQRWIGGATIGVLAALYFIPIYSGWRPFLQSYDLLYPHRYGMFSIGFIQLLRTLPVVLIVLLLGARKHLLDVALTTIAITLYFLLVDPTVPLQLTGGETLNATQTWGSWAWQLGYVSRQYGQSAAAMLGMGPFLVAAVGALWWIEMRHRRADGIRKLMLLLLLSGVPLMRLLVLWVADGL